jgi:dethiobiotin synthetase
LAKRIFVTATNTDVGKTYTTVKLLKEYASRGVRVGVIKPIETGVINGIYPDGDLLLETLKELNGECKDLQVSDIVPISYELAAAPYIASRGALFDFELVNAAIEKLEKYCDVLIIEGAGGLYVPVDGNFMMVDLISFFNATPLLVSHCSLGCINDTLLSLQVLKNKGLSTIFAFNCRGEDESFATLSEAFFVNNRYDVLKVDKDIDVICDVLYNL